MNRSAEEKRRHSSAIKPFSYYKCMIPDYFAQVPLHWHGEFEMSYILSGCGEFICGDERFITNEGDIIIVPPNMLHAIYPHSEYSQRYDTIVFSPALLGGSEDDRCAAECIRPLVNGNFGINCRISSSHQYYSEIKTTVENIFSCAKGDTPQLDMLLRSELLRLFWLLGNSGDIYRRQQADASRSELLRPVLQFISDNFREELSIEQLAAMAHLSKSYFMGVFKRSAGVSAVEYINQLRIKEACEMLRSSEKTIAETAYECGFRNLSNFNKQFRRIVGCAPNEYRKLNA